MKSISNDYASYLSSLPLLSIDEIIYNYFKNYPIRNFLYPWSNPKIEFNKLSDITKTLYHKTELPDIRSKNYKENSSRKYSLSFSCSDLYFQKV
jgi:hypothetical protein